MKFESALSRIKNNSETVMAISWWSQTDEVAVQTPDENSKMKSPYLYKTHGINVLPWSPSNLELFSDEWIVRSKKTETTGAIGGF